MISNIEALAVLAERMPQLPASLRPLASPIVRMIRAIEADPLLSKSDKVLRLEGLRIPPALRSWADDR